ncbi:MAG TPA: LysR substrate-binding domain-containing protein [Ensifer sp.]|nr:LysR substrate-binding domain-containing protein [Ensifer sp.]
MDLGQLRCFMALCEEMNFSRAAERMNMTQPPFSRQIKLLEEDLGVQLFERTTRQVVLTVTGEILRPQVEATIQAASAVGATARQLLTGKVGRLRVAFTSGATYVLLPRLIEAILHEVPDLELQLEEMSSHDQFRSLNANELDLAIVRPPRVLQNMKIIATFSEELCVALPQTHPLAIDDAPVPLAALREETFLIYPPETNEYLHGVIKGMLAHAGVVPRRIHYVRSSHGMMPLVALGLGVAIMPRDAGVLKVEGMAMRPVASDAPQTAELLVLQHPKSPNRVLPTILKLISQLDYLR